jgi:hypothetical protein
MARLNITGKAIVCPYAEVGMDVDKLFQLEIMREDLKKRLRKAGRASKRAETPEGEASPKKAAKK